MSTKWTKRTDVNLNWEVGKKRKRGRLTAKGMNATKYLQRNGQERARNACEMCGSVPSTWRSNLVCLCDKCWNDLKATIGI